MATMKEKISSIPEIRSLFHACSALIQRLVSRSACGPNKQRDIALWQRHHSPPLESFHSQNEAGLPRHGPTFKKWFSTNWLGLVHRRISMNWSERSALTLFHLQNGPRRTPCRPSARSPLSPPKISRSRLPMNLDQSTPQTGTEAGRSISRTGLLWLSGALWMYYKYFGQVEGTLWHAGESCPTDFFFGNPRRGSYGPF